MTFFFDRMGRKAESGTSSIFFKAVFLGENRQLYSFARDHLKLSSCGSWSLGPPPLEEILVCSASLYVFFSLSPVKGREASPHLYIKNDVACKLFHSPSGRTGYRSQFFVHFSTLRAAFEKVENK